MSDSITPSEKGGLLPDKRRRDLVPWTLGLAAGLIYFQSQFVVFGSSIWLGTYPFWLVLFLGFLNAVTLQLCGRRKASSLTSLGFAAIGVVWLQSVLVAAWGKSFGHYLLAGLSSFLLGFPLIVFFVLGLVLGGLVMYWFGRE